MGPAEVQAVPLQWQIVAVTLMLTLTCKLQTSPHFTSFFKPSEANGYMNISANTFLSFVTAENAWKGEDKNLGKRTQIEVAQGIFFYNLN